MKQIILRKVLAFVVAFSLLAPVLAAAPVAQADVNSLLWGNKQGTVGENIGLGEKDPREIAASIIKVLLGFLGIIAVIIILIGGFKWMTSGGDEGKIGEAKGMIVAGFVGLLIILAAFGISVFIMEALFNATNATG